jgi:hypothetical protein
MTAIIERVVTTPRRPVHMLPIVNFCAANGCCAGTPDYMSPQLLDPKACNKVALYDNTMADMS